jgi:hypothetical protein
MHHTSLQQRSGSFDFYAITDNFSQINNSIDQTHESENHDPEYNAGQGISSKPQRNKVEGAMDYAMD